MPRDISITRQEAELITEVLMLTDEWPSQEIDIELRKLFGMCSREEELKVLGKTLEQFRLDWADRIKKVESSIEIKSSV